MRISRAARASAIVLGLGLIIASPITTVSAKLATDSSSPAALTRSVAPSGTVTDLLPDLRMAPLYGIGLVKAPNGHIRLRFGTIGWNVGAGPLEADGVKVDPTDRYMVVRQRVFESDGSSRTRRTAAVMVYDVGQHHNHYHVVQFMSVQLYTAGQPGGDVYGLRKIGYCLVDARKMSHPPAAVPPSPVYLSCGDLQSTSVTMGLDVGWGDDYPPMWEHQWIDVTGIPKGKYRICATVDPLGQFLESNETNNQRWTDVRIDTSTMTVTILDTSAEACGPNVPPAPPAVTSMSH